MYRGLVIDQLHVLDTRKTGLYVTYKEAHDAAERLCKRTMGDRGTIDVEESKEMLTPSTMGKLGGSAKTEAKANASRENGKLGGRPRKAIAQAEKEEK